MLGRWHLAADGTAARAPRFTTTVGGEKVSVIAERVVTRDAETVVRNLRSGRGSSADTDRLAATLQLKAVAEELGSGTRIETHYLTSGHILGVAQSDAKYGKRLADCESALAHIRAGQYPPSGDDFTCARCDFLFICPAPSKD